MTPPIPEPTKPKAQSKRKGGKTKAQRTAKDEKQGTEDEQKWKSDHESEDEPSASDSDENGSVYGDQHVTHLKPSSTSNDKRKRGMSDESDSDEETQERSSDRPADKVIKKPKTKPVPTRRKHSDSPTLNISDKKRRPSGTAAGQSSPASKTPASEWTPLRQFCLGKLKSAFEAVFELYHTKYDGAEASELMTEKTLSEEDKTDISNRALAYASEVEKGLFTRNKEFVPTKQSFQPKSSYRSHYQLIISALSENLRHDLIIGFSSGSIPAENVATMTSKDLATAERLEEINKIEAESMKSAVRSEDAGYNTVMYTKRGLEDAEALQKIQEGIARRVEEEMRAGQEEERDTAISALAQDPTQDTLGHVQLLDRELIHDPRVASPTEQPRVSSQSPSLPDRRPSVPQGSEPSTPVPPPQQPHRNSSFSLSSVLGNVQPAPEPQDNSLVDNDDSESAGFNDSFVNGDEKEDDQGSEIDFSGPPAGEGSEQKPNDDFLAGLPVVWSGTVSIGVTTFGNHDL